MSRLPGPGSSEAVAARVRQLATESAYRRSVAEFQLERAADEHARAAALIAEVVDVLARALDEPDRQPAPGRRPLAGRRRRCRECTYALGTRNRTCANCHAQAAA